MPLWPVHTWLPPAHTIAPTAGSVLLAAVLLKMGTYGIVRLVVAPLPDGFAAVAPVLAVAGVIGILWGGLACLVENDLKRLVAYSSVAHMGFVALGLASGTTTGLQAALFANVAHGIVTALLFFLVGGLKDRWGSADLRTARAALREVSPRLGFAMVVGFAATLGLPGLVGFWGEFLAVYRRVVPGRRPAARPVPRLRGARRRSAPGSPRRTRCGCCAPSGRASAPRPALVRHPRRRAAAVLAVLVAAVVAWASLPGPLLQTTIADVTAITTPAGSVMPVSSAVVSVDVGVLAARPRPRRWAPRLVLVLDVVAPGCGAPTTPLALVALVVGVFGTLARVWAAGPATRARRCACPPARRRASTPPTAVASGAAAGRPARPRSSRCCWPGRGRATARAADAPVTVSLVLAATAGATARRRRPRPGHLAGRPRAGHAAGRGAGRAARGPARPSPAPWPC